MPFYILKEVIEFYETRKEKIIEISQDEAFLLQLKIQYEKDFKSLGKKMARAVQIDSFISGKVSMECPDPEIIELENLKGKPATCEQQKIRSKIGNENAVRIRKVEKLRMSLRDKEIDSLSNYDKECLKYLGTNQSDYHTISYMVEEFKNTKPHYQNM